MAIKYNGNTIKTIYFNGEKINELMVNGNMVWEKAALLYFFDDFDRMDIGATPVIGPAYNYNIRSSTSENKYKPVYGDSGYVVFPGPDSGNFTIEADITRTSTSGRIGVYLGVSNPGGAVGSKMAVLLENNLVALVDAARPTNHLRSFSTTITHNVAYKLKVEVLERQHIKAYFNGVECFTYSYGKEMEKNLGLLHSYCYQNHFVDNLTVYDLG